MLDRIRAEISAFLAAHETGVLCLSGGGRAWAMPVPYRAAGLVVTCRVPAWADGSYYLEADPCCVLIIPSGDGTPCWVSYAALATPDPGPEPAVDFYTFIQLQPVQIDLFDERRGWGARETLELGPADERSRGSNAS